MGRRGKKCVLVIAWHAKKTTTVQFINVFDLFVTNIRTKLHPNRSPSIRLQAHALLLRFEFHWTKGPIFQ